MSGAAGAGGGLRRIQRRRVLDGGHLLAVRRYFRRSFRRRKLSDLVERRRASREAVVSDIRVRVKLTLAEIANGTVTKKLKINKTDRLSTKCGGTGAKDANSYSTCSTCNGAGYVTRVENTFFGRMQTQGVCPTCGGTGKVITASLRQVQGRRDAPRLRRSWRSGFRPAWAREWYSPSRARAMRPVTAA